MRVSLLTLIPCLFLAVLGTPGACEAGSKPSVEDMLAKLGTPADATEVGTLLAKLGKGDVEGTKYAIVALRRAGGPAAARGLHKLMRHRNADIAASAVRATAQLGLRDPLILERLRGLLDHEDEHLAAAAIETLGIIGDGTDVPLLLTLTEAPERFLRKKAFNALRQLSDTVIPNVISRWTWWWKGRRARAEQMVIAAIAAFDQHPDFEDETAEKAHERELARHEAALRRDAWIVLPLVREEMRRWLREPSPEQRIVACQLIAKLGLIELLKPVRSVERFTSNEKVKQAASDCVLRLTGQHSTS